MTQPPNPRNKSASIAVSKKLKRATVTGFLEQKSHPLNVTTTGRSIAGSTRNPITEVRVSGVVRERNRYSHHNTGSSN